MMCPREAEIFTAHQTQKNVGFACELKFLHEALSHEMKDLWWFYMKKNKEYVESLSTFKENIKSEELNLYEIFKKYNSEKGCVLDIVHKPSLKIKNIVLFIKNC